MDTQDALEICRLWQQLMDTHAEAVSTWPEFNHHGFFGWMVAKIAQKDTPITSLDEMKLVLEQVLDEHEQQSSSSRIESGNLVGANRS